MKFRTAPFACCPAHPGTVFYSGGFCPVCGQLRTEPGPLNSVDAHQDFQALETERKALLEHIQRVYKMSSAVFARLVQEEQQMIEAERENETR